MGSVKKIKCKCGVGCKCRKKITLSQKAKIVKKDSVRNDAIPQAPAKMYRDVGANFKIKIKRK